MAALVFTACTGNPTTDTSECPIGPDESIVQCSGDVCLSTAPMPRMISLPALLEERGWNEPEPGWPEPEGEQFRVLDCTLNGQRVVRVDDWIESRSVFYRPDGEGGWTQFSFYIGTDSSGFCGCSFAAQWGEPICGTDCDWDQLSWGASL